MSRMTAKKQASMRTHTRTRNKAGNKVIKQQINYTQSNEL